MVKNSKRKIISAILGIYLSIVFFLSVNFPVLVSDKPLATVDALPQNFIAVGLDHLRVALDGGYGLSQTVIAVLFAIFIYKSWDNFRENRYAKFKSLILLCVIFGCINVAGLCMYWLDALPMLYNPFWFLGCVCIALGWAAFFWMIACYFLQYLERGKLFGEIPRQNMSHLGKWIDEHFELFCFLCIIIAWAPWILSYYPASMDNDVFNQFYAGMVEPSDHHPWFSTCVLMAFFNLGNKIGSQNLGIFLYVIIRDLLLAAIYAKSIGILRHVGMKRSFCFLALAFFAITPVWGAYAKHAFKDTFSAGLFCLYIITLIQIIQNMASETLTFRTCLLHGAAALFTSLFRKNCIYAVLPATFVLLIVLLIKKQKLHFIAVIAMSVLCYFGYNYYIVNYAGVQPSSIVEAMSIPLQQTARTVRDHGEDLTEEEFNGISGMFLYDTLAEAYDPIISDPIKSGKCVVPSEQRKPGASGQYFKTWAKMFFHFPVSYIEAAVGQSYGYYSFTPNFPEQSGNWNSGMTIFDWIGCNGDFDEEFDFHYIGFTDNIRQILHAWAKVWNKLPILSLTDMCAFYTWIMVLMCYYLIINRNYLKLIPFVAIGFMILTCIASPVNNCFRYYAPVAASFPVLWALLKIPVSD